MAKSFGVDGFLARWAFALVLVLGTYNPTRFSFFGWLMAENFNFGPVPAMVAIMLLIAWIVYLRATFLSLGWLGIVLGAALFGTMIWLFIDLGLLSLESTSALAWIALVLVSLLLAAGMSWTHIRRQLSGQVGVDDLED